MIDARVAGVPDPGVLHGLAQLVVVDELARRLHRGQQRRVGVGAAGGCVIFSSEPTSKVSTVSHLLELGQRLVGALVVLGVRCDPRRSRRRRRASRPRAARARASGRRARRRPSPAACSPNTASGWKTARKRRTTCRRSACRRRSSSRRGGRSGVGNDRVVVGDLGVVDHAAEGGGRPDRSRSAPRRRTRAPRRPARPSA